MAEHNGAAHQGAIQEADREHDDGADDDDSGRDDRDRGNGHRPVRFPVDSQVLADPGGTRLMSEGHPAFPRPSKPERHFVRRIVIAVIVAAILGAGLYWGLPRVRYELETVSTDDAFVASHITYASPRVEGLITEVMVDQDDRVEPGQLLAKLDREPFEVAVAQAEASLEEARANVVQARAQVKGQLAQARGQRIIRRKSRCRRERLRQRRDRDRLAPLRGSPI